METATAWEIIYLLMHGLTLAGVIALWGGAPDNTQRIVVTLIGASMSAYIIIDFVKIVEPSNFFLDRNMFRAAGLPLQFAAFLAILRLWSIKKENGCRRSHKDSAPSSR